MSARLAEAALRSARDHIARAMLATPSAVHASLGSVTLREHQRGGASQILRMLRRDGGALLADHVGVGKTYTALAVAARYTCPVIIAPAALRDVWRRALTATLMDATVLSMEGLSRGERLASDGHDLLIIDEAHHLRTTNTYRYAAVAALCRRAHVLLLSATPVHNRRRDLEAQLALFLGSRASTLADAELASHVVRRSVSHAGLGLPAVDGPYALTVDTDDDCLSALMAIPPPLPAADEGVAAALMTYSLVHLWASSRAALTASLRRRRARAIALREAMAAGRHPTRRELATWCFDGSSIQLAFPELVVDDELDLDDVPPSLDRLDGYCVAVADVLERLGNPNPDHARARLLAALCTRRPGSRVVAFSQYAETVRMYARELGHRGGVAELTARGARIASGPVSRRDVIEQFVPGSASTASTAQARRITLLVTTDLLSEGVDLHEAAVVVHLDVPWNPARLEQRVGRLRRLGSPHARIHVYTMMPPTAAERMLEIERRLHDKLAVAASTVGSTGIGPFTRMPTTVRGHRGDPSPSPTELLQSTRETLEDWLVGERTTGPPRLPIVAAVWATAPVTGFLGLVESDGEPRLLASLGGPASEDPAIVHAAVRCAAGNGAEVQPLALAAAMENVAAWMRRRRVAKAVGVERTTFRAVRRTMLERVARCVERAPRHRRAALVSLASTVRDALAGRLSAGAEQGLLTLSMEPLEDEAWLRALGAFCGLVFPAPGPADDATPHYGTSDAPPDDEDGIRVVILIRSGCAD